MAENNTTKLTESLRVTDESLRVALTDAIEYLDKQAPLFELHFKHRTGSLFSADALKIANKWKELCELSIMVDKVIFHFPKHWGDAVKPRGD